MVLGSVAYTLVVPKSARKDNLKCPAFAGIFVGYSDTCTGYLIYSPGTGKIMPQRDVVFDEHWRWRSAEPTADELLVPTMQLMAHRLSQQSGAILCRSARPRRQSALLSSTDRAGGS